MSVRLYEGDLNAPILNWEADVLYPASVLPKEVKAYVMEKDGLNMWIKEEDLVSFRVNVTRYDGVLTAQFFIKTEEYISPRRFFLPVVECRYDDEPDEDGDPCGEISRWGFYLNESLWNKASIGALESLALIHRPGNDD